MRRGGLLFELHNNIQDGVRIVLLEIGRDFPMLSERPSAEETEHRKIADRLFHGLFHLHLEVAPGVCRLNDGSQAVPIGFPFVNSLVRSHIRPSPLNRQIGFQLAFVRNRWEINRLEERTGCRGRDTLSPGERPVGLRLHRRKDNSLGCSHLPGMGQTVLKKATSCPACPDSTSLAGPPQDSRNCRLLPIRTTKAVRWGRLDYAPPTAPASQPA